jgi:hypothetical protein
MTTIKEGTDLKVNVNENDDISEDDLREQEQILIQICSLSSNLKTRTRPRVLTRPFKLQL